MSYLNAMDLKVGAMYEVTKCPGQSKYRGPDGDRFKFTISAGFDIILSEEDVRNMVKSVESDDVPQANEKAGDASGAAHVPTPEKRVSHASPTSGGRQRRCHVGGSSSSASTAA